MVDKYLTNVGVTVNQLCGFRESGFYTRTDDGHLHDDRSFTVQ